MDIREIFQVEDMLPLPDLNQEILSSSDRNMARCSIRSVPYNHENCSFPGPTSG